ncbi:MULTISPECIES: ACP S-malonyltransferase [unclassified Streptomyces]|uniref:ACP S-malonyltransferase n=1 Tax=unclassified Streptomyces TaxID=2593676 RepID=UPI00068AFF59|nr:ACP S-malonyltransferase [Streptomyces sp. NRRL F-2747]
MGPAKFQDIAKFMLVHPAVRRLTEVVDDTLGYRLFDRYRQAEGDYSEYAQVAFLVNCVALAQWAEEELGMRADYVAGASFGGKAAAVFSGALSLADAVTLTARMSRLEQEYFSGEQQAVITQSFARLPEDRLAEILAELDDRGGWHDMSCHVDADFAMVNLHREHLDWFQQRLRTAGALPLYTAEPPMHSRAFGPLRERAEREIFPDLTFTDPIVPVVADQDGSVRTTAEGVRATLVDGIVEPVRWPDVVASLSGLGVGKLYVAGQDALFSRVALTRRTFEVNAIDPRRAMRPRRVGSAPTSAAA